MPSSGRLRSQRLAHCRWGGLGLEAVLSALVAVAGIATITTVLGRLGDRSLQGPAVAGIAPLWTMTMLGTVATGYWMSTWRRGRILVAALAGVASAALAAPMTVGLHGTAQPMYSVPGGDQAFRTEYVTRFATTRSLHDYTFHGLSAFYPPGWFWLTGRTAALLDVEPWRMMKPATIGTQLIVVLAAFLLWRLVVGSPTALGAAVGSVLLISPGDFGPAWYSPYSTTVAVVGVPWLIVTAEHVRYGGTARRRVLLMVTGGVLSLFYYLIFLVLCAALVLVRRPSRDTLPRGIWRLAQVRSGSRRSPPCSGDRSCPVCCCTGRRPRDATSIRTS